MNASTSVRAQRAAVKSTLLAVALAAALAGCTTTPTAPPAVELPAATIGPLDLDHWWTEFNEPALNLHGVITASLGLSSIRSHATPGASVEQQKNELLRAADTALYRAKEHGKDRCTAASLEDARIPAILG